MKVRWNSGSVRLRISPTELTNLERGEPVEERLRVPGAPVGSGWTMILLPIAAQSDISALESVVLFDISQADIARLSDPATEGVYCYREASAGSSERFSFYVEKDFPCVHPRASELMEPEGETFHPPVGFADRKG